ncbi:MAG: fibronectin type III domain-containing protein, partial [Pseudomonadota bacterium]
DLTAATGTATGTLTVTLTPPGDDGMEGHATAYELRWSTTTLDAGSFAAGKTLAAPAPGTAGIAQTFTVSGLPSETDVHLMLRTRDDAGNWSPVSNDAHAMTPSVPPAAISDLKVVAQGIGTATLGWTATGDDGKDGTATAYDLRRSEAPLTDATFAAATPVGAPSPSGSGTAQTASATGLAANKTYYFAIKAQDDRGNWSPLSNVAKLATEDTLPPGAIALAATPGTAAGSIVLSWAATGDDGTDGTAKRYELRRSTAAINPGNWDAATVLAITTTPKAAGTPESITVTGLKGETTHHFVIRALDEADNAGPLSNDASADTAPVAPATVALTATLAVNNGTATATLTWVAPGDDGTDGQATGYDIRYATSSFNAGSFGTATAMTAPTPATAGTTQSVTLSDLKESTTYYFGLKTVDDTNTWSALSNVATVTVPDLTKPAAPSGLIVAVPDTAGQRLAPTDVTASSILGPAWDVTNATDGDVTSSWASAGTTDNAAQNIVVDLGVSKSVEQVKLAADAKYLDLFPRGFTFAVSTDKNTWKTVVTEQAFSVSNATAVAWGFPAESARYVRLAIDDTASSYGQHYAILAEFDVYSAAASDGQARLTWVAPGDDGMTGKATKYEVYRHTQAFSEAQLGSVTPVSGVPAPGTAGTLQTMTVTGLHGETDYFWAVRAIDEAGNIGPLSAVVGAKTNNVPPAAVRNLAGKATGNTTIDLTWTATGDDGNTGVATSIDLR